MDQMINQIEIWEIIKIMSMVLKLRLIDIRKFLCSIPKVTGGTVCGGYRMLYEGHSVS